MKKNNKINSTFITPEAKKTTCCHERKLLIPVIKDISEVDVTTSILFATLTILHQGFKTSPFVVQYLWRSNAIRARRIIQGLILCERNKIRIENTDKTSLAKKVEELGKTLE